MPDTGSSRYTARGRVTPKWVGWTFSVLFGVLVGSGVLVLMGRYASDASATVSGYKILDDRTVQVMLSVTRKTGRDAVCLVRVLDRTGALVGHADVRISASVDKGSRTTSISHDLSTTARGVTAQAGRCVSLAPGAELPFPEPSPTATSER